MTQPCMVVGVDKIRVPVVIRDWGDVQTKRDVPTDRLYQWHESPPQTIHSAGFSAYQAIFDTGLV